MRPAPLLLSAALLSGAAATGASAAATGTATAHAPAVLCTGSPSTTHALHQTVDGKPSLAFYAVPKTKPRGIVVFDHGYGHTAYDWQPALMRAAARDNVIAIAVDYHNQKDTPAAKGQAYPTSRGWWVQEGADDSIAAAKLFDKTCKTGGVNTIYGVSMGGNTSGLVVAAKPKRSTGKPLFDYWYAIEPAVNVTETYVEASGIAASGNAFGKQAKEDIENETGGTPASASSAYRRITVVDRIADIKAAGLKGVVVAQGVDDGLVPYNQSRELVAELRASHIVTDDTTVLTRGKGETGTTLSGNVLSYLKMDSPFAGHANEDSTTQLVGARGFAQLDALYAKGHAPVCENSVLDGDSGVLQSAPSTC